jgi:SnoaL-like domain
MQNVLQVVERYIDAVRRGDASALPLHRDAVCAFPLNTYRGSASFAAALDAFTKIVRNIRVIRLIVDGEHCVAILEIETLYGEIPFAEHIHVVDGEIVAIRAYYDPRPILAASGSDKR